MEKILEEIVRKNRKFYKDGEVADYIPALANANIKNCGLTIIDRERNIYSSGDYDKNFTIQSISKVIVLALVILDRGMVEVSKKVGYEGSEKAFNTISYLEDMDTSKAINPMINSGAIATTSMVKGEGEEKFNRIIEFTRILASNKDIKLNKEVYKSEKLTGDRNRAIAYLMKSKNIIEGEVDLILDTYFKQCSIDVNTVDLANIAFNIGNRFKDIKFSSNTDKDRLSRILIAVMANSGMYNFSGQWSIDIGIPSKSGVAGGVLGVVPEDYGIGFYGPALDKNGNSVLAYRVLRELSESLKLNIY